MAATFSALILDHSSTAEEAALGFAQTLGGALYQLNKGTADDNQRAAFLAAIVDITLENMPELRYEFHQHLQTLEESK